MKSRILRISITVVVTVILISFATWLSLPAERYHMLIHQNVFENIAYLDDDTETKLPIEVMLADFKAENTTTDQGNDTTYTFTLYLQPTGNSSPDNITEISLHPLQTDTYHNYDIFIEQFTYNPQQNRLLVFITLERRRYQLLLNALNIN